MNIQLLKCHGSGNDFILIDEISQPELKLDETQRQQISKVLCDRNHGIGADGILYYLASKQADCQMRMFNPDGSEAEMCGNGLRCIGRYGIEQLNKDSIQVETMKATLNVEQVEPVYPGITSFAAEIAPVSLLATTLPMQVASDRFINHEIVELSDHLSFTALSVPNPHIITLVDQVDPTEVQQCGEKANQCPVFPQGVNVSFVQVLQDNSIFSMTYERGVGITNSCGTAMSSCAFVSAMLNKTDFKQDIKVFNKGGMVICEVPKAQPEANLQNNILLKGNATFVFEASVSLNQTLDQIVSQTQHKHFNDEINAYQKLERYAEQYIN